MSKLKLAWTRCKFVGHWSTRDRIPLVAVDDLEDSVMLGGSVGESGLFEGGLVRLISIPIRILLGCPWDRA